MAENFVICTCWEWKWEGYLRSGTVYILNLHCLWNNSNNVFYLLKRIDIFYKKILNIFSTLIDTFITKY